MNNVHGQRTDAHIHLFEAGYHHTSEPGSEIEQYNRIRTSANIGLAIVVGYEGQSAFAGNNDYILSAAVRCQWMMPLAYVNVACAPSASAIRYLCERGFAGLSFYLPETGPSLADWPVDSLTALAECDMLSVNGTVAALRRAWRELARLDGVPILLSHLGGPPQSSSDASAITEAIAPVVKLCRYPHIYLKLSGLYAIDPEFPHLNAAGIVGAYLDAIGPAKLVWGSDFSPALDAVTEREMVELPGWLDQLLSTDDKADLLGRNLLGLLPEGPRHGGVRPS